MLSNEELKELCTWRLPRPKWLAVLFILMPFGGTVAEVFIPEIGNLTAMLIIVTLISAIMNGPGEELLWRGLFTQVFAGNKWLAIVYPSICFGLWHFAPLMIGGVHQGWQLIVFGPMILGLCWGWIAYKSGSIFWISIAHILVNFFALIGRMFLI